ncbi:pituitary tumor-transforming gene 1 protein-interacting protein-like [Ptychodera flava]|uniref:pituitary tumor-transforming gene 1 protein-interacting protein-like n=1 Tax=Ptychodera flava TaxID=63121 RepID=UPI003969C79B
MIRSLFLLLICCTFYTVEVHGASTLQPTGAPTQGKTTAASQPTSAPGVACADRTTCDTCLKNVTCYWCNGKDVCADYPVGDIFPTKDCDLSAARWLECWLNFEALLISMGVIAGVLLISCCCCVYCCCCRSSSNKKKYAKEDAKLERQREERTMRQEERKAERKAKNDEIRRKYGLMKDDSGYTRFENS